MKRGGKENGKGRKRGNLVILLTGQFISDSFPFPTPGFLFPIMEIHNKYM